MAILVHESGRVIHYNEPKNINKNSIDNLAVVRSKEKSFTLKGKHKRLIQSSAVRMWKEKEKNEMLHFGTVTFSDDVPNEEKIRQELYKKFVKNMTANYGLTGYIAVKERGEKNGRIHFHIIMRMPFVKYSLINKCLYEIHKTTITLVVIISLVLIVAVSVMSLKILITLLSMLQSMFRNLMAFFVRSAISSVNLFKATRLRWKI